MPNLVNTLWTNNFVSKTNSGTSPWFERLMSYTICYGLKNKIIDGFMYELNLSHYLFQGGKHK